MTEAQKYLYNITDEASSFIGAAIGSKTENAPEPGDNTNTRFSPIVLDEQSVKVTNDVSTSSDTTE